MVVHAPTGAGKTYVFEQMYAEMKEQAVFTVPTRALANDKYAEWKARGWDVGISTGDLAFNLDAKVVVATLETQRPRFLRGEGPRLLVIDEYQLIGDALRGVNYELSIALAPSHTQLLLLSGSVSNPQEVADWLKRIGRSAKLVSTNVRPVPLDEADLEMLPNRAPASVKGYWPRLIANALKEDFGPILMFAPRRNAAEDFAWTLAGALPATDPLQLTHAQETLAGPRLSKMLRQRVAYHHSGLSYAVRAGVIEPLAKNGQLRVVVATMGLAAGINFSMRSVVVTGTRYRVGNFERQVQPDELLQMFGRAGRRGFDDKGYVLFSERTPRMLDGRGRQLKRAAPLDWPTLIAVMHHASRSGAEPFVAAAKLNERLFTPSPVLLGFEHAHETGPKPCGLQIDMERARLVRRGVKEMLNSKNEWQPEPDKKEETTLSEAWILRETKWRPALSDPKTLDGLGYGQLCRLEAEKWKRFGRELVLATRRADGLELPPWLKAQLHLRYLSPLGFEREVLAKLPELVKRAIGGTHGHEAVAGNPISITPRGEQIVARFDFSAHNVKAWRDSEGKLLMDPPRRESVPDYCRTCSEYEWCSSVQIDSSPAWNWRQLRLIEGDGTPTRRGVIFSFFHHGEGFAIAAALEQQDYHMEDLIFDLANLRAGPRFAAEDSRFGGRLGFLSAEASKRADIPGYFELGVPGEYGAGGGDVVREIVEHGVARSRLVTETLSLGDIERVLIEWRSLLRQIVASPEYDWDRWKGLKRLAARYIQDTVSPTTMDLPPLSASQFRE